MERYGTHYKRHILFKWWDFLCDYVKELCEMWLGPTSYRKSNGQYGESDGIKWNACISCMKWSMFCIFNMKHFFITYISLQDVTNNFVFEDIREKYIKFLKTPTNAVEYFNVSLLNSNNRHVLATYVVVFRAARERIRPLTTLKMATWVAETCRW